MATLKNNGTEVGRIETLTRKYSYRSNGKVLVNFGHGWKAFSTFTPGSIERIYQADKAREDNKPRVLTEWENLFKDMFAPKDRFHAKALFDLLNDDADGLYSELSDTGFEVTLDEVVKLCEDYKVWKAYKASEPHKIKIGNTILGIYKNLEQARIAGKAEAQLQGRPVKVSYAFKHEIEAYILAGNQIKEFK